MLKCEQITRCTTTAGPPGKGIDSHLFLLLSQKT